MNRIKKIAILSFVLCMPTGIFAQVTTSFFNVEGLLFIPSSNKMTGVPGFGYGYGLFTKSMFADNFSLANEGHTYGTFIRFNYKTRADDGTFTKDQSEEFSFQGLSYSLGVNYYLVPKLFYVGAGGFAALNSPPLAGISKSDVIGVDDVTKNDIYAEDVARSMFGLNYGIHLETGYNFMELGIRYSVSMDYFQGLKNLTAYSYPGYDTYLSHVMISLKYYLENTSISKKYENKILK
jgi:hypothetical protein